MNQITIQRIINGKWAENCYIISSHSKALVIDPGGNFDVMCTYLESNSLTLSAIINTHGHFDHIVSVADLVKKYQCPFYLHSRDERLLKSANLYMSLFEGEEKIGIPVVNFYFDKIPSTLLIDGFEINVLFTPGHTEGSVCFLIGNHLFTGDTLLKNTIGRIDLPGANKEKLAGSLLMLSKLNGDFTVYPGHGDETTLAAELSFNKRFIELIA
ncbi:MBL fold metallo-hydrolase [Sediminibacterium sp.]|uniref:MBL fold metallo-hydrolase n=1 Tax=Sediminibacterium sp. TaxID=1917865 RepID=UPI0025DAAE05|nr:MBL fold metallo-hydrolase [Sediminibacterium sp.]MBW0177659.1 MBL fold metallo-hydrolase [Sediminibacterium sp.]